MTDEKQPEQQPPPTPEPINADRHGQQYLEGQQPVLIKEVDLAAKDYADKRDQRIKHLNEEKKAFKWLDALMETHNLTDYHNGDIHIIPKTSDTRWKVKIGADDDEPSNATLPAPAKSKKGKKPDTEIY